jgi:hypothetical protein
VQLPYRDYSYWGVDGDNLHRELVTVGHTERFAVIMDRHRETSARFPPAAPHEIQILYRLTGGASPKLSMAAIAMATPAR